MNNEDLYKVNTFFHPVLSVIIPLGFFSCIDSILRELITDLEQLPRVFLFAVIIYSIFTTVIENIKQKENKDLLWEVRFNTVLILFLAGVSFILSGWKVMYIIYPIVFALIQRFFCVRIYGVLLDRQYLFKMLRGKTGEDFNRAVFRHLNVEAGIYTGLVYIKKLIIVFQVIIILIMALLMLMLKSVSIFTFVFLILHAVSGYLFYYTINSYMQEEFIIGKRLLVEEPQRKKRFHYSIILLCVCTVFVVFLTRNNSAFSLAVFLPLWEWFAGLFAFDNEFLGRVGNVNNNFNPIVQLSEYLKNYSETHEHIIDLAAILDVVFIVLFTAGAAAFIYILIKPVFKRGILKNIKEHRPLAFLVKRLKEIYYFAARFFADFMDTLKYIFKGKRRRVRSRKINRYSSYKVQHKTASLRKRVQMNTILGLFLKLIDWAEKMGINIYLSVMPGELPGLLYDKADKDDVLFIVDTFEESMFSEHIIDNKTVKRYQYKINEIIKQKIQEPSSLS